MNPTFDPTEREDEREERAMQAARDSSAHVCHWPGCREPVPPSLWGCRGHWFALPSEIRSLIYRTYVDGQEKRRDPSDAYLCAAAAAEAWGRTFDRLIIAKANEEGGKRRPI